MKMKSIVISGRRWTDSYGNTYFSAEGIVDGVVKVSIPFEYGYGDHYHYVVFDALEAQGLIPNRDHYDNGSSDTPWRWCEANNVKLHYSATDVKRKKDL